MSLALNVGAAGLRRPAGAKETTVVPAAHGHIRSKRVIEFIRRFRFLFGGLALLLMALIVYLPILPGSLIMDDLKLIQWDNPIVNGTASPAAIWFRGDFPLSTLALWLEWKVWGTNPLGYHIVNIALHALSSFLLWRLLSRLQIRGAGLAAVLFAVHPVCVASVARIAEIKNTLSLPFFLVSILAYLRYEAQALYAEDRSEAAQKLIIFNSSGRRGSASFYTLSLVSFILALLAKTSVVMLPIILLCCAGWQRRRIGLRDLVHTAPHFLVALAFGLMSIWFQKHQALGGQALAAQSVAAKLSMAAQVCCFYFRKAIWPLNLNVIYPAWHPAGFVSRWLPTLFLFLCAFCGWRWRRTWGRHLLFVLASFVVMLFPAMGLFDAQYLKNWQVSDHLQYAALIVPVAFSAAGLLWLGRELRAVAADLKAIAAPNHQ